MSKRRHASSKYEERIKMMKSLKEEDFLNKASRILDESYVDPDITPDNHEQLFKVFLEKVQEVMPNPTSCERDEINQIHNIRRGLNGV